MRPLALLPLLAACAAPEAPVPPVEYPTTVIGSDPYGDPDYPYPLGAVTASLGGEAVDWGVYDYSVGSVDPAANIAADEARTLRISGDRPEVRRSPPDREVGELRLVGNFRGDPGPRALEGAAVSITPGTHAEDLPFLTSAGRPAQIVVERYEPAASEEERFGRIAGRFSATLCRAASRAAAPDPGDCVAIHGRFDTKVYDNM